MTIETIKTILFKISHIALHYYEKWEKKKKKKEKRTPKGKKRGGKEANICK